MPDEETLSIIQRKFSLLYSRRDKYNKLPLSFRSSIFSDGTFFFVTCEPLGAFYIVDYVFKPAANLKNSCALDADRVIID